MRRRSTLLFVLALPLFAGGALALYWVWAADALRDGIAVWTAEQRARGYQLSYLGPQIGGFPARLDVRFQAPQVTAPQGWRWSGGAIRGAAAFWQPLTLNLDLPRHQELEIEIEDAWRRLTLDATAGRGRIHLGRSGQAEAATVEFDGAVLRDAAGPELRADYLRYGMVRRAPTVEGPRDWTLFLNGEVAALRLPPTAATGPLGEEIQRLEFEATLIGRIERGPPRQALAAWRDAGGLLEVSRLDAVWGPLAVSANGTATLDGEFRPQGAFTARFRGLPETLDRLTAQGLLEPSAALALRLGALALAQEEDGDGRPVVRLPVTLQDGLVYLGPVAVATLSPVL